MGGIIEFEFTYQWVRVDPDTEAEVDVGADSPTYELVDADVGNNIKVEVSYTDDDNFSETVSSVLFGPIVEPAALASPSVLVSNTGQTSSTASITKQYAQGFTLGTHGQGYEISSVSIELAQAPSDLTVSLWIGEHSTRTVAPRYKLFDLENPASLVAGTNKFTAPAGVLAYQNVDYFVVLTDFGASLSIKETASGAEDSGGETGAVLEDTAWERALDGDRSLGAADGPRPK